MAVQHAGPVVGVLLLGEHDVAAGPSSPIDDISPGFVEPAFELEDAQTSYDLAGVLSGRGQFADGLAQALAIARVGKCHEEGHGDKCKRP